MAYDLHLADRIARELQELGVTAEAKKLMGGLCFMQNDKMCVGTSIEKNNGKSRLIARIGENAVRKGLEEDFCFPFQPTGKIMKDFISVFDEGIDSEESLSHWIRLSVEFNSELTMKKT